MQYFRTNQTVLLGILTIFVWTLTIAPALASVRLPQHPMVSKVSTTIDLSLFLVTTEADTADSMTCACLLCSGKKTCCCKPPEKDSSSAPGRSVCQMRSLCDAATESVNLPFSWWTAIVPSPAHATLPPVLTLPSVSFHTGACLETAFSSAPENPPRSLS